MAFRSAFVLLLATAASAHAGISFHRADFDAAFPGSVVETFDSRTAGDTFTPGVFYGGIAYQPTLNGAPFNTQAMVAGFGSATAPNCLGTASNVFFPFGMGIVFTFSSPRTAFGIDIDIQNSTVAGVTDAGESFNSFLDPFPGQTTGVFLGFSADTPFTSVTLIPPPDHAYFLDTIRAVPSPGGAAGLAFAGAMALMRRRPRAARVVLDLAKGLTPE